MFAKKFRVDVAINGQRRPCPLDWLDKFFMRNFTGSAEFDDTLPVSDGRLEAGLRVKPDRLAESSGRLAYENRKRKWPRRDRGNRGRKFRRRNELNGRAV